MNVNIAQEIEEYTQKIEDQRKKRERLQGRLDGELAALRDEEGMETEAVAEKFIEEETAALMKDNAALEAAMEAFRDTYAQFLED